MAAKPKRSRTIQREQQRLAARATKQRHKLFLLERGGTPQYPLEVPSASIVESRAQAFPCPQCTGTQQLADHQVRTVDGTRLREVSLHCKRCASHHSVWLRVLTNTLN